MQMKKTNGDDLRANWLWLIGRRFPEGKVVLVADCGTMVLIRNHRGTERLVPIHDLLRADYEAEDRCATSLSEALNQGSGIYTP